MPDAAGRLNPDPFDERAALPQLPAREGGPVSAPLRVGVIGCGGIAQMHHLPTLAERADLFRIAALADVSRPTPGGGRRGATGWRYWPPTTASCSDRRDLDALLLLSSGCHHEAALDLVRTDKHLFIEKPLAFSLQETEEVARAARGRKGALMVGYHKRFDPAYQRTRTALQDLRDLRYAEVTVLHPDDAAYRAHHVVLPLREGPRPSGRRRASCALTVDRVTTGALAGLRGPCGGRGGAAAPARRRSAALREPDPRHQRAARPARRAREGDLRARLARRLRAELAHAVPRRRGGVPDLGHAARPAPLRGAAALRGPARARHLDLSLAVPAARAEPAGNREDGRRGAGDRAPDGLLRGGLPRGAARVPPLRGLRRAALTVAWTTRWPTPAGSSGSRPRTWSA